MDVIEVNQINPEPAFGQDRELVTDLTWSGENVPRVRRLSPDCHMPFISSKISVRDPEMDPCVPGRPLLRLTEEKKIREFLKIDLCHDELNGLYPLFWLLATQQSDHICSLHQQIVRGREIVITEDPGLHLLWYNNRVFIKPLPPCLTSYAFWKIFLCRGEGSAEVRQAALGYMRSYVHLIKCQSDINIAKKKMLINEDLDDKALLRFLHSFESVPDSDVTLRYRYGELRLGRINHYIKFYKRKLYYRKMRWHIGDYLNSFITPFAFVFALVSAALSAMQVGLAAQPPNVNQTNGWQKFTSVSQWSAVVFLILIALCTLVFPFVVCVLLLRELLFALASKVSCRRPVAVAQDTHKNKGERIHH
jgi:hypothetical protein